jgi:hypothetical protein
MRGGIEMKKTPILIMMVLAIATSAAAQTSGGVPPLDVILGYSLQRTQIANQLASIGLDHVNANGAEVGLVYNFARGIGLEAQGTAYYKKLVAQPAGSSPIGVGDFGLFTAMVGPQFKTYTDKNVNPFIHALFGAARGNVRNAALPFSAFDNTVFAADLGGGVDFKVARYVSLRGEVAYVYTHFPFSQVLSGAGDSQNDVKATVGIVFHL